MPHVTPEFFYFDLGNVLLKFDHQIACRQMAEVAGVSIDRVRAVVFEGALQHRYERGEISSRQFFETFCRRTDTRPEFDLLMLAASAIFELHSAVVPVLVRLKNEGRRLGILSNTCPPHWDFVSAGRYAILNGTFEQHVLSYEVGAMKPDAAIYKAAIDRAGVPADRVFFVDDRLENVEGARAAGIDAVLFTTASQLARDLRSRGVSSML